MLKTLNRDEIFPAIRSFLSGSLAIEENEIRMTSRLIDDLGADSLDFLDILFSLEKKFSVKLRSTELDSLLRAEFTKEKLVDNEYVPITDIKRLMEWLPALKSAPDLYKITPNAIFSYITVESLIILVQRKFNVNSTR